MVIGLCGFAGSGKTTVAKYLVNEFKFKQLNFKDGLVAEMKENLPDVLKELALLEIKEKDIKKGGYLIEKLFEDKPPIMRALMRNYGTEVRRKDNKNYWVDQWVQKAKEVGGNIVVDDVRFDNELQAVKNMGGIIIRVTRDDITSAGSHSSETEQVNFKEDFVVQGTLGLPLKLYQQINQILETLNND